jgi:carbonic anhydrase
MIRAMRKFGLLVVTGSILGSPPLQAEGKHHWSYSGDTGPAQWAALESDYIACGVGKMQSPIDIQDSVANIGALPAIAFDYKPSPLAQTEFATNLPPTRSTTARRC